MTPSTPLAFWNGRFVPFTEATLTLNDAGFVFGATIVDNCRTYHGRLFRWADHLQRFRHDCQACAIPLLLSDVELTQAAESLIAQNAPLTPPPGELQLVTFATPGPLGSYLGSSHNRPPSLGMVTYPVPFPRYRRFFTHGVDLAVVGQHSPEPAAILSPGIKHRSRMLWWLADHAPRPAQSLSVLTDVHTGTLTETSIGNLLAVIDGVVYTPPRDRILAGIGLRVVAELCQELGIPFRERFLPLKELPNMSEAMLTGTGFGLAGVRSIHGAELSWPGPIFERLVLAWSVRAGLDIRRQMIEAEEAKNPLDCS